MNKLFLKAVGLSALLFFSDSTQIFADSLSVQTNAPTNIQNNQATLNGQFTASANTSVWFQYGLNTNYGITAAAQQLSSSGQFSQNIINLSPNTTYHFRAVAQNSSGIVYGQDLAFNSSGSGYFSNNFLSLNKQVINLTSKNLKWGSSVSASPGDVLSFAITLQASGQDVNNVAVKDILPEGLIYVGRLTVNANMNYSGSPISGINLGTIPANGVSVIAYQAQVAGPASFLYGLTTLNNSVSVTSAQGGTQSANAQVLINKTVVQGATYLPTGITNNLLKDSFLIPILLIVLGLWMYFSGNIYKVADRLKNIR